MADIENDAKKIAEIIIKTNTDYRGNLFFEVAQILWRNGQGYTARLFQDMSSVYGLNNPTKKN